MGPRVHGKLSARKVESIKAKGKYGDGGGLWLYVTDSGQKTWVFRWMRNGKAAEKRLGSLDVLSLAEAREKMGPKQVLLGNLNPVTVLRDGTPEFVTAAIMECHRQAGSRFIVGAGCEVPRDTPPENLRALGAYARGHRPQAVDAEALKR